MTQAIIVDTNVPVVANGTSAQASPTCVARCANRLKQIADGGEKLVLDDQWRIILEYISNLASSGQPGVGHAFLKWVLTNWNNPSRCELVVITPLPESRGNFEEFPTDPELDTFDLADRKFVAVALAHTKRPPILQAVDTKWWNSKNALRRHGVRIKFLCPQDIKRLRDRRSM